MELRNLGKSGLRVSLVGLGCNNFGWQIGLEESRAVVHKALDLGVTLLDTADIYGNRGGSEEALGQILGDRRKDIVLATKFGGPMDDAGRLKGASRRYIVQAAEASLKRLKTDWIDLYQLHFPDPLTPLDETLRALDDLVRHGKVRYIGCSNLPGWEVVESKWIAREQGLASFVSCQDEYSLLARGVEANLLPPMQARGLGLLPYFPLAAGLLTGKYRSRSDFPADTRFAKVGRLADKYVNDANWAIVERLTSFVEARGHSLLDLAFSWLASRPTVASVIAGATRPEQIAQNVAAVGWALKTEELAEIDKLTARG